MDIERLDQQVLRCWFDHQYRLDALVLYENRDLLNSFVAPDEYVQRLIPIGDEHRIMIVDRFVVAMANLRPHGITGTEAQCFIA